MQATVAEFEELRNELGLEPFELANLLHVAAITPDRWTVNGAGWSIPGPPGAMIYEVLRHVRDAKSQPNWEINLKQLLTTTARRGGFEQFLELLIRDYHMTRRLR